MVPLSHTAGPMPLGTRCCDPVRLGLRWMLLAGCLAVSVLPEGGAAHALAGAAVGLCLLARLIWGLIGPPSACWTTLWPGLADIRLQLSDLARGEKRFDLGVSPVGAAMSLLVLATLALLVLSGAFLALGLAPDRAEQAHEALLLCLQLELAAYLAGLIWASLHYRVNLLWSPLSGVKPLPDALYWEDVPDAAATPPRAGNSGANP